MSDHTVLFPKPEHVFVQGRRTLIKAVQLRDFEEFSTAAQQLVALFADATPAQIYVYAAKSQSLKATLRACTSLSAWRIRRLPAPTAVELMVHVLRVNSSFFGQALLQAASLQAGPTRSSA